MSLVLMIAVSMPMPAHSEDPGEASLAHTRGRYAGWLRPRFLDITVELDGDLDLALPADRDQIRAEVDRRTWARSRDFAEALDPEPYRQGLRGLLDGADIGAAPHEFWERLRHVTPARREPEAWDAEDRRRHDEVRSAFVLARLLDWWNPGGRSVLEASGGPSAGVAAGKGPSCCGGEFLKQIAQDEAGHPLLRLVDSLGVELPVWRGTRVRFGQVLRFVARTRIRPAPPEAVLRDWWVSLRDGLLRKRQPPWRMRPDPPGLGGASLRWLMARLQSPKGATRALPLACGAQLASTEAAGPGRGPGGSLEEQLLDLGTGGTWRMVLEAVPDGSVPIGGARWVRERNRLDLIVSGSKTSDSSGILARLSVRPDPVPLFWIEATGAEGESAPLLSSGRAMVPASAILEFLAEAMDVDADRGLPHLRPAVPYGQETGEGAGSLREVAALRLGTGL